MKHAYKRILYGAAGVVSRVAGFGSLSTPTLHFLTQGKILPVTIFTQSTVSVLYTRTYVLGGGVCVVTFVMGDMLP